MHLAHHHFSLFLRHVDIDEEGIQHAAHDDGRIYPSRGATPIPARSLHNSYLSQVRVWLPHYDSPLPEKARLKPRQTSPVNVSGSNAHHLAVCHPKAIKLEISPPYRFCRQGCIGAGGVPTIRRDAPSRP